MSEETNKNDDLRRCKKCGKVLFDKQTKDYCEYCEREGKKNKWSAGTILGGVLFIGGVVVKAVLKAKKMA